MQSYEEWKSTQRFIEASRSVPYVPSSEMSPVGNGIQGVSHRVGEIQQPNFDSTAPSSNSGGMVRKQYDWETFINDKYVSAKTEIPEEQPRASGLGDQGNEALSKTSFPQDPMDTQGDEVQDIEGQFEHCKWGDYAKWRAQLHETRLGAPAAPRGIPPQEMAPTRPMTPEVSPAPEEPYQAPPRVVKFMDMIDQIMKNRPLKQNMWVNREMTKKLSDNAKGSAFGTANVQHGQQLRRGKVMSKDEKDRPSRPSASDEMTAGPREKSDFGPSRRGGPMTIRSMAKR